MRLFHLRFSQSDSMEFVTASHDRHMECLAAVYYGLSWGVYRHACGSFCPECYLVRLHVPCHESLHAVVGANVEWQSVIKGEDGNNGLAWLKRRENRHMTFLRA